MTMTKEDIDKMVRWACDTNGIEFAEQIYQNCKS